MTASPQKRPAEAAAPEAKKAKTEVNTAEIKKQVEYYMSDANLRRDKFFHDKISENADGWLAVQLIQSCNKMRAHKASDEQIIEALKDSALKTKKDDAGFWVCRTAPLPALDARADKGAKDERKKLTAHDGGVIMRVVEIPEEITWAPIKDALKAKLPEGSRVIFASTVSDKNTCAILLSPFDGHLEFAESLKLEVGGNVLKTEICLGQALQDAIKTLPKHIQKRREVAAKQRQKLRQKPVVLAGQKFANIATVRGKVKEIILSRKDGQMLIEGSPDTALVKAVLENHPRAAEKMAGMTGIKVDVSSHAAGPSGKASRCFHIVKEGGDAEDISVIKCLIALEAKLDEAEETKPEETKAAEATPEEAKAEEAKAEEVKAEEVKAA